MPSPLSRRLRSLTILVGLFLAACAKPGQPPDLTDHFLNYEIAQPPPILSQSLPVFQIEHPDQAHNRIGSPQISTTAKGGETVVVDPKWPVIYYQEQAFTSPRGTFTNLVYRIHFPETPFDLWPLQLSAGKNVGLLFIVTLDAEQHPLLITTLHTCGCYLAFVPTSHLPKDAWPKDWLPDKTQQVYGFSLPSYLDYSKRHSPPAILFQIAGDSHRIRDIRLVTPAERASFPGRTAPLQPLAALDNLRSSRGESFSFFETTGPRRGYVKNSQKILERLLISWWALDWRVGEDKRFDFHNPEGPLFYTSLKPWARQESNLLNFQDFLSYWGWNL